MPRLELILLGPPLVRLDGQEFAWRTRKVLALIAFLALEEGRQSRERLTGLLWPDAEPEAGRNSLRNTLSSVRETLAGFVMTDRQSVRFTHSEDVHLDASELERAADSLRLETATVNQLETASRLYRGEFLEGFSLGDAEEFDAWLFERRRLYRRQLETVLEHLTLLHEREGRLPEALEVAERWLMLDRLNELAAQRVIGLRALSGNRTGALEAFEAFRTVLRDELGLEPTPQTLALAERARLEPIGLPKVRNPRLPSLPALLLEGRMVGRVGEFVRLVEAYHSSAQGQPRLVTVTGEPGIGKTRLVTEFLTWASGQGASLLRGRAFETGGDLAYQPFTDAIRRVLRSEPDPKTLLSPVWWAELSRLLPELLERFPDLPTPVSDTAVARTRLFEAITRLGLSFAARGPLVVFLDDLQWADEASLELMAYAVRRWSEEEATVLTVFTARSEALTAASRLQAWLTTLGRELPVVSLDLEVLSLQDTARLVEGFGGASADFAAWLHQETGGQPLFIGETLKSLAERGLIAPDTNGWRVVPQMLEGHDANVPGVRAVIEARFSRLSNDARTLLEASAVLGQGFGFDGVRAVADLNEREALAALDELLRSRLLLEANSQYAFSHDRVRETAYDGAGDARRRIYHRRAYRFLSGTQASAAALARHALAAQLWIEGFQASVLAGDRAAEVYAWRESSEHLERARAILRDQPDGVDVSQHVELLDLAQVYGKLVNRYRTLNEPQAVEPLVDEVLKLSRRLQSPWLEAHAHLFKADMLDWIDLEGSFELLDQARQIFERTDDREGLFEIELRQVQKLHTGQQHPASLIIGKLEQMLPVAQVMGAGPHRWVLNALADSQQSFGQWIQASERWRQLLELEQNHKTDTAYVLENLGLCQLNLGDLSAALPNLLESYRIKVEIDDNPTWIGMAASYRSYGLLESGAINEALELTEAAFALREKAASRHAAEFGLSLGMAQIAAGKYAEAQVPLQDAVDRILQLGEVEQQIYGRTFRDFLESHLCAAQALAGNWLQALEHAKTALGLRTETSNERGLHAPRLKHWLEVESLLRGGEIALARAFVQKLKAGIQPGERLEVSCLRAQATLEVWDGQPEQARKHLQRALDLARKLGLPLDQHELEQTGWIDQPTGAGV